MKVAIIINGISRKKGFFYKKILPALQALNVEVFETQHAQHAVELAAAATQNKFDCLLAAGGDGTLNQVLNGILKNHETQNELPTLGVIPLGTGNDFAKLCGALADGLHVQQLLRQNRPGRADVGKITCLDEKGNSITKYFINVCSLGMGPEVVKRLYHSKRTLGPSITYFKSITATFLSHRAQSVFIKSDHWEWQGLARVVAIANGKSFGHGLYVAPDAQLNDGIFSTFIAGNLPLWKFLIFLQTIKLGKKINDRFLTYNTGTSFELTSPAPCPLEAEGEWMGWLPAKIEILTKKLNVLK